MSVTLWADIVRSVSDAKGLWSTIYEKKKALTMQSLSRVESAHVYQFIRVMVIVVTRPLESFENELYTLLEVQSAEIDATNATRRQFPDHVDCELDAIVFHELIVVLGKDEVR